MKNDKCMCYITYAIPCEKVPPLPFIGETEMSEISEAKEEYDILFPPGFVPEWYLKGRYPEDDIE